MIRFRNPISDIGILIENFKKMYVDFSNMEYFDLDDIAEFFAREQLASSSGYIGDEALRRSYLIKDDSRKSMKMQAKSYAELFRFLGWITSNDKALNFNFTYLGIHVALSEEGAKSIFEQCLLGVEYPNHILDVKFNDYNKPFLSMLIFADALDGVICRDEILLGPMNLTNGYSETEINEKISFIKELRNKKSIRYINDAISDLAEENNMQVNSVRNLTRFVISALTFSGWFEKKSLDVYGTNTPFLVMTKKGKDVVDGIKKSANISGSEIDINDSNSKDYVETAFLCMLKRANFDVDEELEKYDYNFNTDEYGSKVSDIVFSPYQYYSKQELDELMPQNSVSGGQEHRNVDIETDVKIIRHKSEFLVESKVSSTTKNEQVGRKIKSKYNEGETIDESVSFFIDEIAKMKQSDFYPLVAELLGYVFNRDAFAPSAGNNNMRYDVMIPDDYYSIPVEVKSPTEEEMLSVKAIRQATENKVLLMVRKPYKTEFDVSSFACGFKLPNDRSDVYKLIDEIFETYGINVAILDIESLIRAAFSCWETKSYFELSDFKGKRGVVKFEDI